MRTRRSSSTSIAVATLFAVLVAWQGRAQQIDQAVESLSAELLHSLQAEGKTTLAVLEFTDLSGEVTPLGRLLAEELIGHLFSQGGERLKIVERSKLDKVIGEQKLSVSGLLEKRNIETFGKVLGVEALVSGTTAVLDDRIRVNTRLIAVPSAELFATASSYMSKLGLSEAYLVPEKTRQDGSPRSQGAPAGPVATKQLKGVSYDLLGCSQQTRLITCRVVVTNNGADRAYRIFLRHYRGGSYFFDQRGHRFQITRVRMADVDVTGNEAEKYLITEIPTEVVLYFEGVPSSIEFIKILHLSTSDGELELRDVHFLPSGEGV